MADLSCYVCKQAENFPDGGIELRPYGPRGQVICFDCMISSPEREAEATRQFSAQLEAAGDVAVVGSSAGPYPYQPEKRNG